MTISIKYTIEWITSISIKFPLCVNESGGFNQFNGNGHSINGLVVNNMENDRYGSSFFL